MVLGEVVVRIEMSFNAQGKYITSELKRVKVSRYNKYKMLRCNAVNFTVKYYCHITAQLNILYIALC